jgi:hypothetical protein
MLSLLEKLVSLKGNLFAEIVGSEYRTPLGESNAEIFQHQLQDLDVSALLSLLSDYAGNPPTPRERIISDAASEVKRGGTG